MLPLASFSSGFGLFDILRGEFFGEFLLETPVDFDDLFGLTLADIVLL